MMPVRGSLPAALRRWRGDESGYAPLEMGLLVLLFFAFIGIVMVAGMLNVANTEVDAAARTAARTISMERDPHRAVAAAEEDAIDALQAGLSVCESPTFTPDIHSPTDGGGSVTVEVSCRVSVQEGLLGLLDLGPTVTISSQVTEVLDQYRSPT